MLLSRSCRREMHFFFQSSEHTGRLLVAASSQQHCVPIEKFHSMVTVTLLFLYVLVGVLMLVPNYAETHADIIDSGVELK